jgi:hypothetical protein
MVVTKAVYTSFITLTGTLAEVAQQLSDDKVPKNQIIAVFYNGTNISAIYKI